MKQIEIYTDGACRGNPGPGGYGAVLKYRRHRKEISGGFRETTNNRMELLAVIVALEKLQTSGHQVHIYSDSRYVVDAVSKGWLDGWVKKNFAGKKNPDLWMRYLRAARSQHIGFHLIKGHHEHPENERRVAIAGSAATADAAKLARDTVFENEYKL